MAQGDLPATPRKPTILKIREYSRRLVRELGFMRNTLADSNLSPSAVHAVIEIGISPGIQASTLAHILRLDKSNTSRQLAKLEALGLVTREAAADDGRSSRLFLTESGGKLRQRIDRFATDQVSNALRRLLPDDQRMLVRSLSLYADALSQAHSVKSTRRAPSIDDRIQEGYRPGCIGDVAGLHARFYSRHAGFGVYFEKKVATELAEFAQSLPTPNRSLWLYVENGISLASIAIDGDGAAGAAHLRWFIVDESLRGKGVGRRLLSTALEFVDRRFNETYLWTFKGLQAARHLYESTGFQLTQEAEGSQWGATVIEQKFLRLSNKA